MRVLVTGGGGLLAAAIIREFGAPLSTDRTREPRIQERRRPASSGGPNDVLALDRAGLDITDSAAVERVVAEMAPDVVINCAAYNDVDGAEMDAVTALQVNALAVLSLSRATQAVGAAFVHYSTDFVFDGEAGRPYRESDPPNPRGAYAASKLLGDWFALDHPFAYVLRVESLFGEPGPGRRRQGSLGTIVRRLRSGERVPVFVDRTVSPSYTADIATATRQLLAVHRSPGLYHCVNAGAATWAEIAEEAGRLLGLSADLEPITLETAALTAPRPKYCALSSAKLEAAGIPMPTWQDALRRHLVRIEAI